MSQSVTEYFHKRCQQWAEQTQESYRCPQHREPNPFCHCADATGRRINGQIIYDGNWEEREGMIQAARRRYHAWAEQQRPEVQTRKEQFKRMIENKQNQMKQFKEWQLQWATAGFETVGYYHKGGNI